MDRLLLPLTLLLLTAPLPADVSESQEEKNVQRLNPPDRTEEGASSADEEEASEEMEPSPYLAIAQAVLARAGIPGIPANAKEVQVVAWRERSAGVFAAFKLKPDEVEAYLAQGPPGVQTISPIGTAYFLVPPAAAPWFQPGSLEQGFVRVRDGVTFASPEQYRLFVDPESGQFFLAYRWNFNRGGAIPQE